jgi:hypothetical protein
MNAHRRIHPWYGFRDGNPLDATLKVCSNGHNRPDAGLMHTMDNIVQIFVKCPVVQMAVAVKKLHKNLFFSKLFLGSVK